MQNHLADAGGPPHTHLTVHAPYSLPLQTSLSLDLRTLMSGFTRGGPGSSRELAPLGVVLHQHQMEDGETTLSALRKGPRCTASQVPTVGTCSSTHLVLAPLPSLSHFPILPTVLPGITSQVNYLH